MTIVPPLIPAGGFRVILTDPPWAFRTHDGRDRTPTQKTFRDHGDHYSTMSIEAMSELPVAEWAAKDCALVMWIVGSHCDAALELAARWGFTFKTDLFYWLKQKLLGADQIDLFTGDIPPPKISMGYYTRKQLEPVWLFTRGRPQVRAHDVRQLIIEPPREHSRKPEAQYERIEALFDGPYLEMFARSARPGWSAWGNEVGKFSDADVRAEAAA